MIRNIVCDDCKERISPENLPRHASAFMSQVPIMPALESHNLDRQETAPGNTPHTAARALVDIPSSSPDTHSTPFSPVDLSNSQLISSRPPSPIPTAHSSVMLTNIPTPAEPTETSPSETPPTKSVNVPAVIANPITQKPQDRRQTVKYNSEIQKVLDVTFVHAFEHTSSVNAVRFSPDGNFLAAGLTYDLGRTLIYDLKTKSMSWYVLIYAFCTNALTDSVSSVLAEYVNKHDKKTSSSRRITIRCVCFSRDGRHVVVGGSDGIVHVDFIFCSSRGIPSDQIPRYGGLRVKEYGPHLKDI
jgi:WD40 repeat protein